MQFCNEQIRTQPLFSPPCASATYGSTRMCRRKNKVNLDGWWWWWWVVGGGGGGGGKRIVAHRPFEYLCQWQQDKKISMNFIFSIMTIFFPMSTSALTMLLSKSMGCETVWDCIWSFPSAGGRSLKEDGGDWQSPHSSCRRCRWIKQTMKIYENIITRTCAEYIFQRFVIKLGDRRPFAASVEPCLSER